MLTVQSLLDELGLELAAGAEAAASPVRWVHISELEDPTPWLSGGELMLTTGMPLDTAAKQRAFIKRLATHNLAGLGLGTGFDHPKLPKALVDEAEKQGFPLFEVPYSMPFIALTEKAFARLVNEQYEVLQRGIAVQRRLERLVLEERGLAEIAATISSAAGGTVVILNGNGERLAERSFRRELAPEALAAIRKQALSHGSDGHPFVPAHPAVAGRGLAQPVVSPGGGQPQAWVVFVRDSGGLGDFERLILQQAVAVVALELMRRRVARETERRLAGDVLAGALGGRLDASELRRRLEPFGIGGEAAVLVFTVGDPAAAEPALERALASAGCAAVVAPHAIRGRELLCAVVDTSSGDPLEVAAAARRALAADRGPVRVAASRPAPPEALRHAFHEARCALEATAFADGDAPEVASWRDLGAFTLLLSVQDDEALRLYCERVLGPIEDGDADYGGELLRSLEAFIEHNGQWERAAREVYCHRHTLRYRMRKVEELTGRDLSRAHDRIELWLALRARELVPMGRDEGRG
jgi:PucR family transcriptional regulator, purine catabolism regulatory protein